ncbi:hypothetical protein ES288_D09G017700v1 [Gossypium darwinii]|uniref:CRC domain-containing protein n=1 Tax=Gossypium darwinii TaxID=34276 RepID=A0A5D2B4N3_GOSDA|nr:hypothetical protein ES288_D09G017700v1 [Gossypium darwinii]
MESYRSDIEASLATSPSEKILTPCEKKSPVSEFLNDLSPIMPSRARASLCKQRLYETSFTSNSSLLNSPHLNIHQRPINLNFLQRDEIGASSSNGCYQDDFMIKHSEYHIQHDEQCGVCFNASEVTIGKTSDNANDGVVEISDDERLDKMLDISSKNIREHVESDEFMEHVGQVSDSKLTFLGGNQAMSMQLPYHILPLNHYPLISPIVGVGDCVGSDHHGACVPYPILPLSHDPLIPLAGRVGDHVDSDHHGVCVPENMEDSQIVSCFHQIGISCQQFGDRVDQLSKSKDSSKRKRQVYIMDRKTSPDETEACKHCNCRRSRCLKLYCECFAAGIYCEDCCACENCLNKPDYEDIVLDIRHQIELRNPLAFAPPIVNPSDDSPNVTGDENLMNTPSARHKRGCKCKRSKCLKKYCECYRAKVGCSDGCHCEDCDNSFGKKSESMFQRVEKQQNQSHEVLNTTQVMSDSTLVGITNPFLSTWEKLADNNHLTVSTHPYSREHDMRDCQNVSQVESEKGTSFHCYSFALSPKQPCRSKEIDDIYEIMVDGFPNYLMETSNPINTVNFGSSLGLYNSE